MFKQLIKTLQSQKKKFDASSSIILTFIKRSKIKFWVEKLNLLKLSLIVLEVVIINVQQRPCNWDDTPRLSSLQVCIRGC
jgi:hypothetical protein